MQSEPAIRAVSDVCVCGRFRNQHENGTGNSKKTAGACDGFKFLRRCNAELDLERWSGTIIIGGSKCSLSKSKAS